MVKKTIGWVLVSLPFVVMFVFALIVLGLKEAVFIFVGAAAIMLLLVGTVGAGIYLLTD